MQLVIMIPSINTYILYMKSRHILGTLIFHLNIIHCEMYLTDHKTSKKQGISKDLKYSQKKISTKLKYPK